MKRRRPRDYNDKGQLNCRCKYCEQIRDHVRYYEWIDIVDSVKITRIEMELNV